MTREKVVSVLETTRLMFEMSLDDSGCDKDSAEAREDNEKTIEAINEAIKALKRKPCDDVISREEALKVLRADPAFICTGDKTQAIIDISSLPPVTPERPKGGWIRVDNTKCKCSKCEVIHMIAQYPSGHIDWCPNCGADMRGGKE